VKGQGRETPNDGATCEGNTRLQDLDPFTVLLSLIVLHLQMLFIVTVLQLLQMYTAKSNYYSIIGTAVTYLQI